MLYLTCPEENARYYAWSLVLVFAALENDPAPSLCHRRTSKMPKADSPRQQPFWVSTDSSNNPAHIYVGGLEDPVFAYWSSIRLNPKR
jgi:hypothetical protein